MNGFIALHRKIRKSVVFNDLELYRLWTICLTEASHKEHEMLVGRQIVKLQKGQFVTGRFDLHKMYNEDLKPKYFVSEKTVWRWLETLQKLENVTITSTNKFSIVTVVNWELYQFSDQQNDQQMTNKRPTNDQQMTTNNNGNKGNKETIVAKDDSAIGFETFWGAYPTKGSNKKESLTKWNTLWKNKKIQMDEVLNGVSSYVKYQNHHGYKICAAQVFLNQERWKVDWIIESTAKKRNNFSNWETPL